MKRENKHIFPSHTSANKNVGLQGHHVESRKGYPAKSTQEVGQWGSHKPKENPDKHNWTRANRAFCPWGPNGAKRLAGNQTQTGTPTPRENQWKTGRANGRNCWGTNGQPGNTIRRFTNFSREPPQKWLVDMNPHLNDAHQSGPLLKFIPRRQRRTHRLASGQDSGSCSACGPDDVTSDGSCFKAPSGAPASCSIPGCNRWVVVFFFFFF